MLDRLTEEQKAELKRRYQDGESTCQLAREFGYGTNAIGKYLCAEGVPLRSKQEAGRIAKPCSVSELTPAALEEMYWGPDKLSFLEISRKLGCAPMTIIKYAERFGIKRRSLSEQKKVDLALGRIKNPIHHAAKEKLQASASRNFGCYWGKNAPKWTTAQKKRIGAALLREIIVPCAWCGKGVPRKPRQVRQYSYSRCSRAHGQSYSRFLQKHGPDAPRPLIVEALYKLAEKDKPTRILIKSGPGTGTWLPHTLERLLKLGKSIGAREPEAEAVIDRQREEAQALIEKRGVQ
jgi:DNA-binding CsgD family transcriptional regulator